MRLVKAVLLVLIMVVAQMAVYEFVPIVKANPDFSLIGTSTSDVAVCDAYQTKSFYANGRFWVFYSDGDYIVYKTSTNGATWTEGASSPISFGWEGPFFSVVFDGAFLHYIINSFEIGLLYRRGIPNGDGSITWSADEQTIETSEWNCPFDPDLCVDSNGYAWVTYLEYDYNTDKTNAYVTKSGNNDGTWGTTPDGFPLTLIESDIGSMQALIIALQNGKVLVAFFEFYYEICKAKVWNGLEWRDEVDFPTSLSYYASAVAQADDVHFVYPAETTIYYATYVYSSNSFSSETIIEDISETEWVAPAINRDQSTNDLYVFWSVIPISNYTIYYRKYRAGTEQWEDVVNWITETEELTHNDVVNCFENAYGGYVGLVYTTLRESPYNVKFAYLTLEVANQAPTIADLRLSSISDTTNITSITVNTWYDWEANVTDADTLNDVVNLTIRIANNPSVAIGSDSAGFNESSVYWFRYLNSTDAWEWYSGSAWTATSKWLETGNCSNPTKTGTNGWYLFRIKLSKVARYSSQWEFSALAFDSSDNSASKTFTGISIAKYDELIMITTTHKWTSITVGGTNVLVDEGAILFNVSCNYHFKLQARSNSSYAESADGYKIGIGNITIHKDTLGSAISLTDEYADIGGLAGLDTLAADTQYSFKLWATIPEGTVPWKDYVYECQVQTENA